MLLGTTTVEEVEQRLQPPALRDLGRSLANIVLRALLLGAAGALVGILRSSSSPDDVGQEGTPEQKEGALSDGKGPER